MQTDPNVNLNLMLGLSVAPLSVANAYLSQLERGSIHSLQSHDRAMSRALNTFNTLWFNLGLDAVSASRNAVRRAEDWACPTRCCRRPMRCCLSRRLRCGPPRARWCTWLTRTERSASGQG